MRYSSSETVQRLGNKILKVKVTTVISKVKSRSHHDIAHLQLPYQVLTSYTLQFPRYSPEKMLKVKVTTPISKVISTPTNVPTKYQLPTPYILLRYNSLPCGT